MIQGEKYLRLLALFHYLVAGIAGLFALFPVVHLTVGLMLVLDPNAMGGKNGPPPAFLGWFFVVIASVVIALGLAFAGCVFAAGRCLAKRRHYLFCLVMAGVECVFMPFGTALGVFTIVVLLQDAVKGQFLPNQPPASAVPQDRESA